MNNNEKGLAALIVLIGVIVLGIFYATATTTSSQKKVMKVEEASWHFRRKSRSYCKVAGVVEGTKFDFTKRGRSCPCEAGDKIFVQVTQKKNLGITWTEVDYVDPAPASNW